MENKKSSIKRFHVTQSLRFGSKGVKFLFYAGVLLETAAVASICYCIGSGSKDLLGAGVICAVLAAIWIFAVHMMSNNNYGLATVAFHEKGIVYKANSRATRISSQEFLNTFIRIVDTSDSKTFN